jgi:hypothetical protein
MKKALLLISIIACFISTASAQTPVTIIAVDSMTRAWNITQYTANDVVLDSNYTRMLRFTTDGAAAASPETPILNKRGGGVILSGLLEVGDSANTTNGNFKLLLFRDTVAVVADNVAWTTAVNTASQFLDEIDFALTNNGTTMNYSYVTGLNIPFQTTRDDRNIYGVLLAKGAYTPVRGQKIIVKLGLVRN